MPPHATTRGCAPAGRFATTVRARDRRVLRRRWRSRHAERAHPRPLGPERQHAGPLSALLAPVPIAPLTLSASVVRPGRSVEMLEASLAGPGGDVVRARAWRLATAGITADWEQDAPPSGPEDATAVEFFATGDRVGWHTAMEIVFAGGKFLE